MNKTQMTWHWTDGTPFDVPPDKQIRFRTGWLTIKRLLKYVAIDCSVLIRIHTKISICSTNPCYLNDVLFLLPASRVKLGEKITHKPFYRLADCFQPLGFVSKKWTVIQNVFRRVQGPVHTNAFSKECVFIVIENASTDSLLHHLFDAFTTVHTKTFENNRTVRCDVSWTLCTCSKQARLWYFRSSFFFWCVFDRSH